MKHDEVRVKRTAKLDEALAYLQDMLSSLKQGRICVQHGEEAIDLSPPPEITVQVKARRKADKESISLKVSWHAPAASDNKPSLRISSTAPAKPPAPTGTQ